MDETVYKIALAGYLHDIGKFAERAHGQRSDSERLDTGFYPDERFLNDHMDMYQPHYQGNYTHKHAVYTAAFIDHLEKLLPKQFNKGVWGLEDSFMNLAAGHHKPETPMQWIIAIADRVSSGFDRTEFDNYNMETVNKEIPIKGYKRTRLLTIFEGLSTESKWKSDRLDDYQYRYPLKELSPDNIFPANIPEMRQIDSEQASNDYRELFFSFIDALEYLSHKDNIPLWFEHFDSLFMIYGSHIPAATVGYVVPDVSLFDHCRTTSALSSALYRYHIDTDSMTVDAIQDYTPQKFLLISGDFYGIQDFIFSQGGSTGKASAKLLRGRSFYVSLLSELAADMLCREIGLPSSSIILNAAGKFTILAHNTDRSRQAVEEIGNKINNWLIKNFFGQASMGFSFITASCDDFVSGKFSELWSRLSKQTDKKKYSKFNLTKHGGCVEAYLDSFDSELGICPFCVKRPADKEAHIKSTSACRICSDHAYIGENLVKGKHIAITTTDADLAREKLLEPVFGDYQLSFKVSGKLSQLSHDRALLKYWDIGIAAMSNIAKDITAKFLNGYVPKYEDEEITEEAVNRILAGRKSDKAKEELFDSMEAGIPKTFAYIAKMALNENKDTGKFKGLEALGILKADVDNLGLLFACGMRKERLTLSRLATMSRQMNNYFSIFLPHKLKTDERFINIYTVFAGGDDLFLIGPWNRIIEFAGFLNESFKEYVCRNEQITLSAGFALHKPNDPVLTLAETSEHALSKSKSGKNRHSRENGNPERNNITIYGETVKWHEFTELQKIKDAIHQWLDSEMINNAMIFRLNEFIEMRRLEEEAITGGNVHLDDMECLKWHSRFKYTVVRNIGKGCKGDDKEQAIEEMMKAAGWLETHKGALKIPLWQIIYNRR
ncbi:MAG: type III-A CRISPR-associated protein Cas10/Csm1 [Nitrospirae bacterium]|nr:type III-A CRISPR-associated protein Cas10/Csm1 [Nitrospirota bacterium]